jgi:two-component system chemotaxis sensor kinase CheA
MPVKEKEFLNRLLITFQGEAEERLRSLDAGLVELERISVDGATQRARQAQNGQTELVELLFRELHSLKGAARAVNLGEIEAICQAMEDVFSALKRQSIAPSQELLDTLHQATESLNACLAAVNSEPSSQDKANHAALIRRLKASLKQPARPSVSPSPTDSRLQQPASLPPWARTPSPAAIANAPYIATPAPAIENVRVATARLEDLLLQVEELVTVKLAAGQRMAEVREAQTILAQWHKRWNNFHPSLRAIGQTLRGLDKQQAERQPERQNGQSGEWQKLRTQTGQLLEFLEWNHQWIETLESHVTAVSTAAQRDQRTTAGMIDHLREDMKQVLMLPFSSILEVFPSVTREVARRQNKEVELAIRGAEIEVDRRILQEIRDPLMHLIRNCIDHGIETPEIRQARQKSRRGMITITVAQQDSNKFEIVVTDDGSGLDLAEVRASATRLGLISTEVGERMDEQGLKSLVFRSGLSTSPVVTDLSGRGLGLAIVQEKVDKLGGAILLESEPQQGTTFRLRLPLTLATLRGLLVRSAGHMLILPITHVERVARVSRDEIQRGPRGESVEVAGQPFPLVCLSQPLELASLDAVSKAAVCGPSDRLFIVLLNAGDKRIAFEVDEIIGEQEVLMKGLGAPLMRVRNIAGATVLGNGQVIPIINVVDLIKSLGVKSLRGVHKDIHV